MRDFKEIIEYLKSYRRLADEKVYDKDVAQMLALSAAQLATLKKRNSIPYEQLLWFCHKESICCNSVFFKEDGV
jgi:DNA-binding Xre family transcriptional regulator